MQDSDLEVVADSFEDFDDVELGTDSPEAESEEISDDETDTEEQPQELAEDETSEEGDLEVEEDGSEDQVRVQLSDGEEVTLQELKDGYFREKDYTHKTTELASERAAIAEVQAQFVERSKTVETTFSNLIGYLQGLIPPEPPLELFYSNRDAYQEAKLLHERANAEIRGVLQQQQDFSQSQQGFSEQDVERMKADQDAKLVKAMPQLSDPAKRAAFDESVKKTALEFGFSEDEVAKTGDHRILQLVHYARLGKRAVANRNNARRRVESPKKGKPRPAKTSVKAAGNRKAKERLSKSGSLEDAMSIDFD